MRELADRWFVFIEQQREYARHARHLVFVDDLNTLVAQIAERALALGGTGNRRERRLSLRGITGRHL